MTGGRKWVVALGAMLLGTSLAIAEVGATSDRDAVAFRNAHGEPIEMCPDSRIGVSENHLHPDDDHGHEHGQDHGLPASAEAAAQAFIDEMKLAVSPDNPDLERSAGSDEELEAMRDYLSSDAFAPARSLSVGEKVTQEGDFTSFARVTDEGWVDVHLDVLETKGGFIVAMSFICETAMSDPVKRRAAEEVLDRRVRAEEVLDRRVRAIVEGEEVAK